MRKTVFFLVSLLSLLFISFAYAFDEENGPIQIAEYKVTPLTNPVRVVRIQVFGKKGPGLQGEEPIPEYVIYWSKASGRRKMSFSSSVSSFRPDLHRFTNRGCFAAEAVETKTQANLTVDVKKKADGSIDEYTFVFKLKSRPYISGAWVEDASASAQGTIEEIYLGEHESNKIVYYRKDDLN